MLGDLNLDGLLASYPPTGAPAIFFDRPPDDHEGFPFVAMQVTPIEGAVAAQNKLLRTIEIMFHVWSRSSGHSFAQAQDLTRLLELTYDRQRVKNTEFGACRMFLDLKTAFDETTEGDDVIHMLTRFTVRGYDVVLQNHLLNVA